MKESSIKSFWFNRQDPEPRLIYLQHRYDENGTTVVTRDGLIDRIDHLRSYDIDVVIEVRALEAFDNHVRRNKAA